ncbi:PH domain-containing protein [Ectothiorhodospira mobilis]|uniref:PH domain-containing protein n=1 Tax=Ectothiorhodospira mobilis TaxID=195064 RepID=UPI001EE91254|nr:PH domain-containing protein [Ectothiorhodospira mobilis]MCG5534933.1 PH domain-containing protein [Ectothiorhodospira mobilis]
MNDTERPSRRRWIPLTLAGTTILTLVGALALPGQSALVSLVLFIFLFPCTLMVLLVRWWPRRHCRTLEGAARWRRRLYFAAAAFLLAAVVNLLGGMRFFGTAVGTTLLTAGTLLVPPAMALTLLAFSLSRDDPTEELLEPGEVIRFHAETHWGVFLPSILLTTLALVLALGPFGLGGLSLAAMIYLLLLPGLLARALTTFINTEVTVTDRHLITVTGTLWRRRHIIPLKEIQAAGVSWGWLGRLLRYGKVGVICHDETSLKLSGLADPMKVQDLLDPFRPDPEEATPVGRRS